MMGNKLAAASGMIAGYASLFHKIDLGGDAVLPGAFRDSLRQRGARGVKMLFQHDPAQPIGVWHDIREDANGLYVRGQLNPHVETARNVWALLCQGAVEGLSIGFKASKARKNPRSNVRQLEKVDLWEVSVVTFPMLPQARIMNLL
jgi:uncharacterized protein